MQLNSLVNEWMYEGRGPCGQYPHGQEVTNSRPIVAGQSCL